MPVPSDQIGDVCNSDAAAGCTSVALRGTCDGPVWFNQALVPETLSDIGDTSSSMGRSMVDLATVLYHESVHTVQDNEWGGCLSALEPEAYDHAARFADWVAAQLTFIRPVGSCISIDAAVTAGMNPGVRSFLAGVAPDLDPAAPVPTATCDAIGVLRGRATSLREAQRLLRSDNRISFRDCVSSAAAESLTRASSSDFAYFASALPNSGIVYVFKVDESGPTLSQSITTPLVDIYDLQYMHDVDGREFLAIFGGGTSGGTVLSIEDATFTEEFATPPDGYLDGSWHLMSDSRLHAINSYVAGGTRPALLWDLEGQRATQLVLDVKTAIPNGFGTVAVRVPAGREGRELWHDPTRALAIVTGNLMLDDTSSTMLFEDLTSSGIYTLTDEGTVEEIGGAPPRFDSPPMEGRSYVWARAGIGRATSTGEEACE